MQKIFILGSCVSRDALAAFPDAFDLVTYLARTSMASIEMPPVADDEVRARVAGIESQFQRTMLLNDLDKTTLAKIRAAEYELLLVDFIDERFNLAVAGQSVFSYSGELEKSGLALGDRTILTPGSDSFLSLWLAGMSRLLAAVDKKKVVLNRAYWAEHFPDGSDVSSMGWIRRNNAMLQSLYELADRHWGLACIDYPPELTLADPQHRWGVAPYHYVQPFYAHAIDRLQARFAGAHA